MIWLSMFILHYIVAIDTQFIGLCVNLNLMIDIIGILCVVMMSNLV